MPQIDNNRIVKNTLMLYGRTALVLFISLLTSRVTLRALGIDNFGINSAVAGVIAMFSVVSGSLSRSISRFITFELGKGNHERLQRIFSTSLNIQLSIGVLILLIGETIGAWFLNTQMNIPEGRLIAANWVLQCAIFSFFIGLTQTPYTACIVGHEKMSAFAWFSIVESIIRLIIVYLLYILPFDTLITLSILGFVVSQCIRTAQRIYCIKCFAECRYSLVFDKAIVKEMTGFAGWSFLTNTVWIFSNQGVNILINIFFGVTFNAARGLAVSLEGYIKRFCTDFMTAMNPQITKSYAAGEIDDMNKLICRGTRLAYILMFVLSLPLMFEAYTVLYLWLGMVPDYTVLFFRLSTIGSLMTLLGQTGVTSIMATGQIKLYTIVISSVTVLVFPLTWLFYSLGAPVEVSYFIFIAIYAIDDILRLFIMRHLWGFPILMYIKEAIIPILYLTFLSLILPFAFNHYLNHGIVNSFIMMLVCFFSSVLAAYMVGLKSAERKMVLNKIQLLLTRLF